MKKHFIALSTMFILGGIALTAVSSVSAHADDTGLASIHAWRKVGKKTCMSDHDHFGSGTGATQKVAELSAIRNWASFTDLEYGSNWANFGLADRKSMKCERSGGGFTCGITAYPCRGY